MVCICNASLMEPANLFSLTPNLILLFFFRGKFSVRKSTSCCGALPAMVELMMSRATTDDSKG